MKNSMLALGFFAFFLLLMGNAYAITYNVLVLDSMSPYPAVASAQVVLKTSNGTIVDTQTTNSSGYVVFTGLSAGNYTLVTSKSGYFTDTTTDTLTSDPEGNLILLCRDPYPLFFTVGVYDGFTYLPISIAQVLIKIYSTGGIYTSGTTNSSGLATFGICFQDLYTVEVSKSGYNTSSENISINVNFTHNVFLNRLGAIVDLFITPNGILTTGTATVTISTHAAALPIDILVYGIKVGDTLPSYIGIFNQINQSTYQYSLSPNAVGLPAGTYNFRANVTDVFGTLAYSNLANLTITNVTVTTVPTEPIPAVNQTEWTLAGFGWLVPFFTPALWALMFSAIISGLVSRLTRYPANLIVAGALFLGFSAFLTLYHVYPDIIGVVLLIIGGMAFAFGIGKMFTGGGGGA